MGTRVEVKARFDGSWSPGFEVADVEDEGVHVRRMTDGRVLPSLFHGHEVRRERPRTSWAAEPSKVGRMTNRPVGGRPRPWIATASPRGASSS